VRGIRKNKAVTTAPRQRRAGNIQDETRMDVFCFDFDGVICDSAPETALAAWNASQALWPADTAPLPEALQERFCRLRPVLHTGFEAVPLMRLIKDGEVSEADILADFAALRDGFMAREHLSAERLQQVFGEARDRLIEQDRAEWLKWNRFYPGIRETLAAAIARHPAFIITTKQQRFVGLLLSHHDIALPADRVFGLEQRKRKVEIMLELLARPELAGATFHFLEDRLETLMDVMDVPELGPVRLYLGDWGYNTAAQREEAKQMERVQVVSREAFRELHGL
jgi:phosphoglycolate phosphatase-like HAD superfamily hydrolase